MAVSSVASTTTSTQLLAPDTKRTSVIITNTDANRLYVLMESGTASASNHSFSLAENENARLEGSEADGEFTGVWAADGTGAALITTKF